ncbi:hypothetical protein SDC9_129339 [bioreactor metagenome]|uniref:Uncharacterized protein n=1 Tax=bioreactor metagenome TaxID=1076179 RepID=A0A645CZK1_9ZZZZ
MVHVLVYHQFGQERRSGIAPGDGPVLCRERGGYYRGVILLLPVLADVLVADDPAHVAFSRFMFQYFGHFRFQLGPCPGVTGDFFRVKVFLHARQVFGKGLAHGFPFCTLFYPSLPECLYFFPGGLCKLLFLRQQVQPLKIDAALLWVCMDKAFAGFTPYPAP